MPAIPQHFPVSLTQAQRKVVAEFAPGLASRLKLDERNQRSIRFTAAELRAITGKAAKAMRHAGTGMVRNSLRHVADLTAQALERSRGLGTIPAAERVFQFRITLLAANAWWEAKRDEVEGRAAKPAPGTPEAQKALLEAWAGQPLNTPEDLAAGADLADFYKDKPLPRVAQEAARGTEKLAQVQAGLDALLESPAPPDRTVGKLVETWLAAEFNRVHAGKVGLARMNMNKVCLNHFLNWVGNAAPAEAIDEGKWLQWYNFLGQRVRQGVWEVGHVDRIFGVSKRFVRFLWEMRLIDLPRNLDNRNRTFAVPPPVITLWTNDEIHRLLAVITGQTRLHVFLMLNCGFVGKDISDLRQDEVDWSEGVITRKRSKTRKEKDVSVVRYKLWPRTFALLREYRRKLTAKSCGSGRRHDLTGSRSGAIRGG